MAQAPHALAMLLAALGCVAVAAFSWRRPQASVNRHALTGMLVSAAIWCAVATAVAYGGGPSDPVLGRAFAAAAYATAACSWFLVRTITDSTWRPSPSLVWATWAGLPMALLLAPLGGAPPAVEQLLVQLGGTPGETTVVLGRVLLSAASLATLGRLVMARARLPRFAKRPLTTLVLTGTLVTAATAATVSHPHTLLGVDVAPLAWGTACLITADVLLRNHLLRLVPPTAHQVLDAVSDSVVVIDPMGRLVGMNEAGRRLLRAEHRPETTRDLLGRTAAEVLHPALLPSDSIVEAAPLFVDVGGALLEARSDPVRGPGGEVLGVVVACREVTAFIAQQAKAEAAYRAVDQERSRFETLTSVLARELSSTEQARTRLAEDVMRDPLTGLQNRRRLQPAIGAAVGQARHLRRSLAVFIVDIDHFKGVNDTYGHQAGDRVLTSLASLLDTGRAEGETVIRYGGEEFVVIVPAMGRFDAVRRAEELRRLVADMRVELPGQRRALTVTISVGISLYPENGEQAQELLASADVALYAAKNAGRNCVVTA